jgi:hypothetical protein
MIELWRTIGRACIDENFCKELQDRAGKTRIHKKKNIPDLNDLYQYLVVGQGFLLSRWELGEVNRIFQESVLCDRINALRGLIQAHDKEDQQKLCKVIGLACVDQEKAESFRDAAEKGPHALRLALHFGIKNDNDPEVAYLENTFKDLSVVENMAEFSKAAWTRARDFDDCKWALSYSDDYEHVT